MEQIALPDLKSRLKLLIAGGNAADALDELLRLLPSDSGKYNIAIQLSQQGKSQKEALMRNILSFDQAQTQQAAWTSNLLALIDLLHPDDFAPTANQPGPAGAPRPKAGSVLYAIPSRMEVQREKQCVVRLSFDETYLLDNFFKNQDSHIRALRRLEDRMEVELIDPTEAGTFAIRSISTAQQKVERDDYTEWIFFVKPLQEGQFPLFLKVSVILLEDGEKVRKEVVLQEVIEVVTQLPEKELEIGAPMRHSGFVFIPAAPEGVISGGGEPQATPKSSGRPGSKSTAASIPKRQWLAGALLVAGGLLLWTKRDALADIFAPVGQTTENVESPELAEARLASMSIRPPFAKINVAPTIYTVDPEQDRLITLPTGTTIFIPAGVFVWPDNTPVKEPVQIHFREFHDAAEIIVSGIPMKIRSEKGDEEWFQTAGMFEINGTNAEGKEVRIANGKSLTVNLASKVDGPYDFWKFDPDYYNWQNKQTESKAQPAVQRPAPKQNKPEKTGGSSSGLRSSLKPPAGPDDPRQHLEIKGLNLNNCPNLKGKKTVVLLYAGKIPSQAPEKNPQIFKEGLWHQRILRPTADPNVYELSLFNDTLEYVIPVNIMLEGVELTEAQAAYEKRLREERSFQDGYATVQYQREQAEFRRKMDIQGFGVYNYDVLWKRDDLIPVYATFEFGDLPEAMYKNIVVYLITEQQRTVISLPYYNWSSFRFSPSSDNCIVAILPGDKVAVFNQADFNAQINELKAAKNKQYVFQMRILEKTVGTIPDLQEIINTATVL